MALRMLGDATNVSLAQHLSGFVTFNGTFNDIPRTFVLDTTLPGVAHKCKSHTLSYYSPGPWNETCPRECTSNLTIPMLSSGNGSADVDPFASNLTFADISLPNFRSGRICGRQTLSAFRSLGFTANSVFGLGPGAPTGYPNISSTLDTIPWSKYSIYLTKTVQDTGSFLLQGGVDTDLIAKNGWTDTTLPATTATGWTVNVDAFATSGAAINAECSATNPCRATVAASSPVIQLGKDIWDSVMAGIDRRDCSKDAYGDYFLYSCYDTTLLPILTFTLGDRTFSLNKTDYTIPMPKSDTRSVYVLIATQNVNLSYSAEWILGTPFLRSFYSSFDKDTETVRFYCKDGVNCVAKGKPVPGFPSTSSSGVTICWVHSSTLLLAAAVLFVV